MKRTSPDSDEDYLHGGKKRKVQSGRLKHHRLNVRQPRVDAVAQNPQDDVLMDYQLHKGICLALHQAGFTTVTRQALSSLRDAVQEHLLHLSWRVAESMRTCRRSKPTPQDFIHALAQFDIAPSSLIPELCNEISGDLSQASFLPPLTAETSSASLFSPYLFISSLEERSIAAQRKGYIPKHFPQYPAKHSYHATPVFSQREADPLKIREDLTREGMQAEQALRKLMAASKVAEQRSKELARAQRGASESAGEQLLDEALASVKDGGGNNAKLSTKVGTDESDPSAPDDGIGGIVNYDRMFRRRTVREPLRAA